MKWLNGILRVCLLVDQMLLEFLHDELSMWHRLDAHLLQFHSVQLKQSTAVEITEFV